MPSHTQKNQPSQPKEEFLQFQIIQRGTAKPPIIFNSLMAMIYIVLFTLLPKGQDIYPCSKALSR